MILATKVAFVTILLFFIGIVLQNVYVPTTLYLFSFLRFVLTSYGGTAHLYIQFVWPIFQYRKKYLHKSCIRAGSRVTIEGSNDPDEPSQLSHIRVRFGSQIGNTALDLSRQQSYSKDVLAQQKGVTSIQSHSITPIVDASILSVSASAATKTTALKKQNSKKKTREVSIYDLISHKEGYYIFMEYVC